LIESTKSEINVTYMTQDKFNEFNLAYNNTSTKVLSDINILLN